MRTKGDIAALIILIVLAVILVPILAMNLTLIIQGSINDDVPPSVFGIAPMAVTTGSMDGDRDGSFAEGSLIFVKILDDEAKQEIEEGDVVTFRSNGSFVTHRVISVTGDPIVSVITQGDANNANDGAIPIENVVGLCIGSIGGLGAFSMFLQTPVGILVVIGVPVAAYIVYDIVRITLARRKAKAEEAAGESDKDEEIRRLRALLDEKNGNGGPEAGADGASAGESARQSEEDLQPGQADTDGDDADRAETSESDE